MIDWMRYRWLYLLISGTVILSGIFSLIKWGLLIGVEFKGGTLVEYRMNKDLGIEKIGNVVKQNKVEVVSIQKTGTGSYLLKLGQVHSPNGHNIKVGIEKVGVKVDELRFETIGPTVGPELIKKTAYGMLLASLGILFWVAIQFKSFKFGLSAVLAMIHDSLVVIGTYSFLDISLELK